MIIEILCTGDEILTGKTINTNFSHISSRLNELGLTVRWGTTVGDDRETLMEALRLAASRADAVIVISAELAGTVQGAVASGGTLTSWPPRPAAPTSAAGSPC